MTTLAEMIQYKYRTHTGMVEMRGVVAVCDMIAQLGKMGPSLFYILKRERDKRIMANLTRKVVHKPEPTSRETLISYGLLKPRTL